MINPQQHVKYKVASTFESIPESGIESGMPRAVLAEMNRVTPLALFPRECNLLKKNEMGKFSYGFGLPKRNTFINRSWRAML